ncbi:hypothetical protein [Sphingomonas abietis]|uniref:DUF2746 domain-containing protein n=1 Tax=Sphingomonas abietis TaxID=3012344 RepID=A0ABY7NPN3_9SPHN|nr:hypothetical protein [Sphingomonas abietis]WBO21441.1 hypothetical protein PBT88_14780 [Sphingomonas abietis]
MNHGEWMVVVIVGMVLAARIYRDRCGGIRQTRRDTFGDTPRPQRFADPGARDDDAENRRLREEVRALKDRIAVLERIATDSSTHLDREIEALRNRP